MNRVSGIFDMLLDFRFRAYLDTYYTYMEDKEEAWINSRMVPTTLEIKKKLRSLKNKANADII